MFRDRLLIACFFIALFINTVAVCVVGAVTGHPIQILPEVAKKSVLRPIRIGAYKPPKAPKSRPTPAAQNEKTAARKPNVTNKNAARLARRNPSQATVKPVKIAKAPLDIQKLQLLRAAMVAKAAQERAKKQNQATKAGAKATKTASKAAEQGKSKNNSDAAKSGNANKGNGQKEGARNQSRFARADFNAQRKTPQIPQAKATPVAKKANEDKANADSQDKEDAGAGTEEDDSKDDTSKEIKAEAAAKTDVPKPGAKDEKTPTAKKGGDKSGAKTDAQPGKFTPTKFAKLWDVPPDQKIVLPKELSAIKFPENLPIMPGVKPLTPEQIEELRALLHEQNLKQWKGLTKEQLKKMLDARKGAERTNRAERKSGTRGTATKTAKAPAPKPTPKKETPKRAPREAKLNPDEEAAMPQGLTSPFRYKPWSPAYQKYAALIKERETKHLAGTPAENPKDDPKKVAVAPQNPTANTSTTPQNPRLASTQGTQPPAAKGPDKNLFNNETPLVPETPKAPPNNATNAANNANNQPNQPILGTNQNGGSSNTAHSGVSNGTTGPNNAGTNASSAGNAGNSAAGANSGVNSGNRPAGNGSVANNSTGSPTGSNSNGNNPGALLGAGQNNTNGGANSSPASGSPASGSPALGSANGGASNSGGNPNSGNVNGVNSNGNNQNILGAGQDNTGASPNNSGTNSGQPAGPNNNSNNGVNPASGSAGNANGGNPANGGNSNNGNLLGTGPNAPAVNNGNNQPTSANQNGNGGSGNNGNVNNGGNNGLLGTSGNSSSNGNAPTNGNAASGQNGNGSLLGAGANPSGNSGNTGNNATNGANNSLSNGVNNGAQNGQNNGQNGGGLLGAGSANGTANNPLNGNSANGNAGAGSSSASAGSGGSGGNSNGNGGLLGAGGGGGSGSSAGGGNGGGNSGSGAGGNAGNSANGGLLGAGGGAVGSGAGGNAGASGAGGNAGGGNGTGGGLLGTGAGNSAGSGGSGAGGGGNAGAGGQGGSQGAPGGGQGGGGGLNVIGAEGNGNAEVNGESNNEGPVDSGDGSGAGGDFEVGPFNALETDMEGLGMEQDISGTLDPSLSANSNFTDTGFTPAQGTAPDPPESNPASKSGLAGALVLPPMPPVGTEKGRNPQLRFPKPNTRAALSIRPPAAVSPRNAGNSNQRPAPRKTEPRRIAKMPSQPHQTPPNQSAPAGLSVGSYSEQGTVPFSMPRSRLPLGTPVPDLSTTRTSKNEARAATNAAPQMPASSISRQQRAGVNKKTSGNGRDTLRAQIGKSSSGKPMSGKLQGERTPTKTSKTTGIKTDAKGQQVRLAQGSPGQIGKQQKGQILGAKQGQPSKNVNGTPQMIANKANAARLAQLEKSTAKATQNSQLLSMLARKVLAQQMMNQKVAGNAAKTRRFRNSNGVKDGSKSPLPPTPLPDSDAEIGDGSGLKGEYYLGRNFDQYVFTRADPNIEFYWGPDASPSPRLPVGADWTVRWTGKIEPRYSETYTFFAAADDGVRVWVDHKLIIDNWTLHPMLEYSGQIKLEAGKQYSIRVDFFEGAGPPAAVWLYWQSGSQKKEFVPQEQLFYPLAGDDAELDKDELPGNS